MAVLKLARGDGIEFSIDYGQSIELEIQKLVEVIDLYERIQNQFPTRWLAVKLLEGDQDVLNRLKSFDGGFQVATAGMRARVSLQNSNEHDLDTIIADRRYTWINNLVHNVVDRTHFIQLTLSDRIDKFVTHRYLGIPIFLALMWIVFKMTTDLAAPFLDWVGWVITGPLTRWTLMISMNTGLNGTWVESLAVDGILAGVGGVLVFVPVLFALYIGLALLEESGYMARAGFVMDRSLNRIGLQGKSFLPLMLGFGCNVPAIYATRTLENEKDRILTALLIPFMSCGARLPVYVLFAAVFFPRYSGWIVFFIYLLGILTAFLLGIILKRTLFKSHETAPFVMELPPYRLPSSSELWMYVWERTGEFIKNAWTMILAASIVIWLLLSISFKGSGGFANTDVNNSALAAISESISPIFKPAGFGSWQSTASLISGFVAKEVVVSTVYQVHGVQEEFLPPAIEKTFIDDVVDIIQGFFFAVVDAVKAIPLIVGIDMFEKSDAEPSGGLTTAVHHNFNYSSGGYGALAGLAFMVFVLLYTPCIIALAAEKQEIGVKWMWLSIFGQSLIAWIAAVAVFQIGRIFLSI